MLKRMGIRFFYLAVIALIMVTASTPVLSQKNQTKDAGIVKALEVALINSDAVAEHLIDISVDNGEVVLSGSVDSILAKEQARRVVESMKGVRSVVNLLTVKPVVRNDQAIEQDVETAFIFDPATDSFNIDAQVDGGTVILTGEVDSWAERGLAENVAKNIKGIRKVNNRIAVKRPADRSDTEIRRAVLRRLELNPYVNDEMVKVKVSGGKVVITGQVRSLEEKMYVYAFAWTDGVSRVDTSRLEVNWNSHNQKRRKKDKSSRTEELLVKAVSETLSYDPRVNRFDIRILADDRTIFLGGTVDNLKAKRAATQGALNTMGVGRVRNYLKVRPGVDVLDQEIEQKAERALLWDSITSRFRIDLSVRNQKVYLYGDVDSFYEKNRIEEVVSGIRGVVSIANFLNTFDTQSQRSSQGIEAVIRSAFAWNLFVGQDRIDVAVANGVATLTGRANSWHDVRAAVMNAFEGGARAVQSRVEVDKIKDNSVYHQRDYYDSRSLGYWVGYRMN